MMKGHDARVPGIQQHAGKLSAHRDSVWILVQHKKLVLRNYQFATVFLFQLHGKIKRFNGTFHLGIRRRLRGDAL